MATKTSPKKKTALPKKSRPPKKAGAVLDLGQPPIKHLLVDLDGTLLHNNSLRLSIEFIARAVGLLRSRIGVRKAMRALLAIRKEFETPNPSKTNDIRVLEILALALEIPLEEARGFLRESLITMFPKLRNHFYPVAGGREFLDWAKERFPMTLATNPVWPLEVIEMRVRWAGIDPAIFSFVTYANQMKACKPTAQYYLETLSAQGLDAQDCMLVGNELKMDLPAVHVGMRVFIVGDYKELTELKLAGQKARAWRGSYAHLQQMLEKT